jgi:adenine-specific DNA-methyltransferase
MADRIQRLELDWVGKDARARVEPRILIDDAEFSYHAKTRVSGGDIFDNRLIFGDNFLALKALEQDFCGVIKCIYIDPPYNTGNAFEHYDDSVEHSIWLSLLRDRLELLRTLLKDDGVIVVQIGVDEMAYLKVLMDEVFGRSHLLGQVAVRMSHSAGMKRLAKDKRLIKNTEYLLIYFKNTAPVLTPLYEKVNEYPVNYYQYIESFPSNGSPGKTVSFMSVVAKDFSDLLKKHRLKETNKALAVLFSLDEEFRRYVIENCDRIARRDSNIPGSVSVPGNLKSDEFIEVPGEDRSYFIVKNDKGVLAQLYTLSDKVQDLVVPNEDGDSTSERALTNLVGDWWDGFWRDMSRVDREGGVEMKESKKPERLIYWVLSLITQPGDWVLDSFLGSGTTAAVAHKMGRRWIGIELGEHCHTLALPRLRSVVDGTDGTGITAAVGWKGGGGFRYYKLAPSLLEKDRWGNWVISREYNPAMLAEAVCKLMGFTYAPSETSYWMQGRSSERDFIYVTTQSLTHDQLKVISEEVGDERSLLICCKAFHAKLDAFPNLTVRKIPQAVLRKCEWGKDDYSLNVANLPMSAPATPAPEPSAGAQSKRTAVQRDLFATPGE